MLGDFGETLVLAVEDDAGVAEGLGVLADAAGALDGGRGSGGFGGRERGWGGGFGVH